MKIFINYIKDRKGLYLLVFLLIGMYYMILNLYHVWIDAIQYVTLLNCSFLLIYFVFDFYKYYHKAIQLQYIENLDHVYIDDLPLPSTFIEKQYHQLLVKMDHMHHQFTYQNDQQYQDMMNYFTLWIHQIKTPISALRLLIQQTDISQSELLMQIQRIEQYVEMVLHYIKALHMESDLQLKRYDLGKIVNDVVKKQATFFVHKKIQLILDDIDFTVLTDEKWISFVIEQILSNALKYTKEGFIHIYVKDEVLCIEDSGIGIKAEDLPRLFEKGFTGYNGRVDKKASGLGLYLCKQVIDNLGYHIKVKSTVSKGTTVMIDFHVDDLQVE